MAPRLLNPPPYSSPEWVEWRKSGVGASDLPAIAGIDPYRGEYSLALLKRGLIEPFAGNNVTRWGHRIEGVALDAYAEMTGAAMVRGETWADDRWPHLWATLDGRTGAVGIEVKATRRWTVPPDDVVVQCQAQMGIAGLDAVDVVRVSPYGEPIITTIERDDATITALLDLGEAWYLRYVIGDELPPVDGSVDVGRWLDRKRGEDTVPATSEQAEVMARLRAARARMAAAEDDERRCINALKASMAGVGVVEGEGWRIAWSATKGRSATDWRAVATVMRAMGDIDPAIYDEHVARHTTTGEPGTRFVPTWTEEGDAS